MTEQGRCPISILYKSSVERGLKWQEIFAREIPDLPFHIWPETGDPAEVEYLVAWQPPENLAESFANLRVVFSVGAGVDQFDMSVFSPEVKLVRMLDPAIAQGIVEYVTFATLALHRDIPAYLHQQRMGVWKELSWTGAQRRRVGVMGMGNLGQAAIAQLCTLGFPLSAWSRTLRHIDGVKCFAGDDLPAFLAGCDILICMLPLTEETRHILCAKTFSQLPTGAAIVNAGRGGHLNEQDLLEALACGQISAAVLDVFEQEPPAADHPFWQHPKILMTPHIAASTQVESGCQVLMDNIRRHRAGLPMNGEVNRDAGY